MDDESPRYEDNPTIHAYLQELELVIALDRAHYAYDCLRSFASGHEPSIKERFDELRVQIKYLRFDVEACRRERDFLQQALEGDGRR